MKKFTLCLMLIFAILIVPVAIFAAENVTEVGSAEELVDALKTSGTIKLTADIDLDERLLINSGVKITLDLNDKTLDLPTNEEWNNYGITVKGELIITGNGVVNVNGLYGIGTSTSGGNVTIKNGTFNGTESDYMFGSFGGKIVIEDGTFNGNYCVVNAFVEYTGTAEVKGGTFNNKETTAVLGNTKVSGGIFNQEILKDYLTEGFICPKINNEYHVVSDAEYKITVNNVEGGKVVVNKEKAQYGDIIEFIVTIDEGYKLVSLEQIVNGEAKADLASNNSFTMLFEEDVVLKPIFVKLTQDVQVPTEVANEKEVEDMILESLKELIASDKDLAAEIEGKNVEVEVQVKSVEADKIDKEEKEQIEKEAAKEVEDIKVVQYIDITILVKDSDTDEKIDELENVKKVITFTVAKPELPDVAEGYTRIFYVIRNHNGDIDVWEAKEVDGKLSFETDKFSTYAIAYKDVKEETTTPPADEGDKDDSIVTPPTGEGETGKDEAEQEPEAKPEAKPETSDVPKTGDNIVLYIVLATISVTGLIKLRKLNLKTRKH